MTGGRKSWECSVQGWEGKEEGEEENHINVYRYLQKDFRYEASVSETEYYEQ